MHLSGWHHGRQGLTSSPESHIGWRSPPAS